MSGVFAQDGKKKLVDINEISFDDILDAETTVGSKKTQKISNAPAIISVITENEIKNMGALNLYEVLNMIPGVNVTETYYGYASIEFRGSLQTHYNNKSLLLINNHPMYNVINGSYYLEQIPINSIKRIEIIRGPGSILYGTNAFSGVIKIVTKSGADINGFKTDINFGSFGTINPGISFGKKINDLQINFNINYLDSKGYPFDIKNDEDNRSGELSYKNDVINTFFGISYKTLHLNFGYFKNNKSKFGLIPTIASTGIRDLEGFFFDISYTKDLSKKLSISFAGYYDSFSKKEDINWYPPIYSVQQKNIGEKVYQEYSGSKFGIDVQSLFKLSEKSTITGGIMYEHQAADPYMIISEKTGQLSNWGGSAWLENQSFYDLSGYIQIDTRINKFGLIGGVRFNNNKGYGMNITPRLGVVYNVSSPLSFKLLYGKAYRSPSIFEKSVYTPNVLIGNEELKPEGIDTIDIGFDYMLSKNHNMRLNFFFITTNNLITRSAVVIAGDMGTTVDTPQYANSDGQNFTGIEGEIKGKINSSFVYFLNFSYILNGTEAKDDSDIFFIQKNTVNLGINYKFCGKFTLSPYLQYRGARKGLLSNSLVSETEPYLLANLNLQYSPTNKLDIMLIMKNVFDVSYSFPEYIRRNISTIPGGPKRTIYCSLSYKF